MKKNLSLFALVIICSLLLALCIIFIVFSSGENAGTVILPNDISESFAADEITYLVYSGVLETQNDGEDSLFFPKNEVTREYFVCALVKLLCIDTDKYSSFELELEDADEISEKDMPFIRAAIACGIVSAEVIEGKNYFLPNEYITREEASHIIGALSNAVIATTKPEAFSDIESADAEYIENLKKLINLDILIGYPDGTIKPKNSLTREEFALMLYRMLQNGSFGTYT